MNLGQLGDAVKWLAQEWPDFVRLDEADMRGALRKASALLASALP